MAWDIHNNMEGPGKEGKGEVFAQKSYYRVEYRGKNQAVCDVINTEDPRGEDFKRSGRVDRLWKNPAWRNHRCAS